MSPVSVCFSSSHPFIFCTCLSTGGSQVPDLAETLHQNQPPENQFPTNKVKHETVKPDWKKNNESTSLIQITIAEQTKLFHNLKVTMIFFNKNTTERNTGPTHTHTHWCYLVRRLCLIINRFSSAGTVCMSIFLLPSLDTRPRFLFLLSGRGAAVVSPSQAGRFGLLCSSGSCFDFLNLFLFCPLLPPLGKSSASFSTIFAPASLEVATGLFGFHGLTPPVLSGGWPFFALSDGLLGLEESSKKMCLFLWWLIFCFFFDGSWVDRFWGLLGKWPFIFRSEKRTNKSYNGEVYGCILLGECALKHGHANHAEAQLGLTSIAKPPKGKVRN